MAEYHITNLVEINLQRDVNGNSALADAKSEVVSVEQKTTQLFELLRSPICRYLTAILGSPGEAEELTQEAFLKLYLQLRGGQTINDVRAWIFRVAHNLAIDSQKNGRREAAWLDYKSWDEICLLLPDTNLDPEQKLLQSERFERLHISLGQLSPQQRQCLLLRAEGFRYREIAEILNIGVPSVAEFVRRAIKRLANSGV